VKINIDSLFVIVMKESLLKYAKKKRLLTGASSLF